MYRLKKFVRRNKLQVLASFAVCAVPVAGVIGTTWQAINAELARADEFKQRKRAEQKEQEANLERAKAIAAAEHEQQARRREAERAEAEKKAKLEASRTSPLPNEPTRFWDRSSPTSIHSQLHTISELTQALKKNLKKASEELEGTSVGDPLTVAAMQNIVGTLSLDWVIPNRRSSSLRNRCQHFEPIWVPISLRRSGDEQSSRQLPGGRQDTKGTSLAQRERCSFNRPSSVPTIRNVDRHEQSGGKLSHDWQHVLALPLFEKTSKLMLAKLATKIVERLRRCRTWRRFTTSRTML